MTSPTDDAPNSGETSAEKTETGAKHAGNVAPDPKEKRTVGNSPQDLSKQADEILKNAAKDLPDEDAIDEDDIIGAAVGDDDLGGEGDENSPWTSVEALVSENEQVKDQLVRTLADMDNLRKRTAKEKQDISIFAVTKFAQALLGVCDTMERAVASTPEVGEDSDPALKSFLEGIDLTHRQLLNTMEKNGIKRIEAQGEAFDPNLHQAVMEAENNEVAKGLIVNVAQTGYMIEDRVLRPAMVVVSKGSGAATAEETNADSVAEPQAGANDNEQPANSNTVDEPDPAS